MASNTTADGESTIIHNLDLDDYGFQDIEEDAQEDVKREVSSFLKNQVLRKLDAGTSPVAGEGRFRILDQDYARNNKGGRRTANLELEGDLKDSLIVEPGVDSFITYGHQGEQVPKADGHNQLSGKARAWAAREGFPKRRYIPDTNQNFTGDIVSGIRKIIEDSKRARPAQEVEDFDLGEEPTRPVTTTTIDSDTGLFSDNAIEELLNEAFERRGAF